MRNIRKISRAAMAVGSAAALTITLSSPASAAGARDGVCDPGEFCLYYNTGFNDSLSDFTTAITEYGMAQPTCYEFRTRNLPGAGECVRRNARSALNLTSRTIRIYIRPGCEGEQRWVIPPKSGERNLQPYNDLNESHC